MCASRWRWLPLARLGRTAVLPVGVLGMIFLAAAGGCGHTADAPPAAPAPAPSAAPVKPSRHTFVHTIEQPGQIEAFEQTPIFAKIGGYVEEVCVDMNARVKKDDCLAKLSVPEMHDDLAQNQALAAQAWAEVKQRRQALEVAEANYKTAEALVAEVKSSRKRAKANRAYRHSEYQRFEKLVQRQALDDQTLDEARNQFKVAEAVCEEIEAKIQSAEAALSESAARRDKARADIQAAEARHRAAEAAEQKARTLLQYADVRAPFAGVVTRRNVHPGHLLKPGLTSDGKPLFVVVCMDRVRVFVDVPEAEAALVHPGSPARVRVQGLNDREIEATVTRISWALDPSNRTLRAEVELPNPREDLRPGMYAYASIRVEHARAWALPAAAVHRAGDGAYCSLVEGGKTVRVAVRTGLRDGRLVEILKKQLPPTGPGEEGRWQDLSGEEAVVPSDQGMPAEGQAVP